MILIWTFLAFLVTLFCENTFSYLLHRSSKVRPALPLYGSASNALVDKVKQNLKVGSTVVIKYGGHAMENDELKDLFLEDVADLYRVGYKVVIVHGGGPQIAKLLKTLNVESKFVDGLRVTDDQTLEVAQMVLCGLVNKDIVRRLSQKTGVKGAVGLSGLDSGLISGVQKDPRLGLVGEPKSVKTDLITTLLDASFIPVIAPIGTNAASAGSLNINADTAAGAVAEALKADIFLLFTDIVGVLDKEKKLIAKLPIQDIDRLTADGTISGGMIPKLETAGSAVRSGVKAVSIMDGRVQNCLLRALTGEEFGTLIYDKTATSS